MIKPSKEKLDVNLTCIRGIEAVVVTVKRLYLKSQVTHKCYQSLKSQLAVTLNNLYNERQDLKKEYHKDIKTYYVWKNNQVKISHKEKEAQFNNIISKLNSEDRQLLKEFWHKV